MQNLYLYLGLYLSSVFCGAVSKTQLSAGSARLPFVLYIFFSHFRSLHCGAHRGAPSRSLKLCKLALGGGAKYVDLE